MTLRATIEIVPFGEEESKHTLFTFNISNVGMLRRGGFGYDLYEYRAEVFDRDNVIIRTIEDVEHVRRDGACDLVRKVLERFEREV